MSAAESVLRPPKSRRRRSTLALLDDSFRFSRVFLSCAAWQSVPICFLWTDSVVNFFHILDAHTQFLMTGEWAWEVLFWPCSLFRSSLNSCLLLCWRSLLKIVFILMVYTISATLYSVQVALGLNWPLSPSFRPKISYFENKMCVLFISIIKTAMVKYQASEFALWIQTHFNKQPETICLASSCISTMTIKGWNISTVFSWTDILRNSKRSARL